MMTRQAVTDAPLWVIESTADGHGGQAHALASRLGCSFRRVRDRGVVEAENGTPKLILTSGFNGGLAGLALRRKFGVPVVHCASRLGAAVTRGRPFDVTIVPVLHSLRGDRAGQGAEGSTQDRILPVFGGLSIVSPSLIERAHRLWQERLEHLPEPRVAVVLDSGMPLTPAAAMEQAKRLSRSVDNDHGSLLVSIAAGVSREVADAFVAGLERCFNLVWRHGEPDDDPTLGFMACADAIVILCGRAQTLVEAVVNSIPVFLGEPPGWLGARNALATSLLADGYVRVLDDGFSPWPRDPLDEAGRIARLLMRKFSL